MKHVDVLFIIGSVEPGKNGVGDYTRCLAAELSRNGLETVILATHDKYVQQEVRELQSVEISQVQTIRYPASRANSDRLKFIKEELGRHRIDWVSLQYVPYSFHSKGLPVLFIQRLITILGKYKVHLMFHECWVGMLTPASWKLRLYGFLQKHIISSIGNQPNIRLVTTSNEFYQAHLSDVGVSSELLPLFSNISYASPPAILRQVTENGVELERDGLAKTYLIAGIFGSIYPFIDLRQALEELTERAKGSNRELLILTFGRAGIEGLQKLQALVDTSNQQIEHLRLGELSEREVSSVLQKLEVAVSCTPKPLIGKSGVYAAMKLHNVEVLTYDETSAPRKFSDLIENANERLSQRPSDHWSVKWVAQAFMAQLFESSTS